MPAFVWFDVTAMLSPMRATSLALGLILAGCGPAAGPVPASVSQQGGVALHVRLDEPIGDGPVVVLVDGIPAGEVVVEGPRLVRAQLPSLPNPGRVDVEVIGADGGGQRFPAGLEVEPARLAVEARESTEL